MKSSAIISGSKIRPKLINFSTGIICAALIFAPQKIGAQDPGAPDTVYLFNASAAIDDSLGGQVRIEIRIKTDNTGANNDIAGMNVPLIITNSNAAAAPVLDTDVGTTFAGSAVASFDVLQHNAQGDPSVFPLQTVLGALNLSGGLFAGDYLFATLVFSLQDTTTLCIDTVTIGNASPQFSTSNGTEYVYYWQPYCLDVTTYPPLTPPIFFIAHSPVNLIIIDPNNDSIGINFNTMANASYAVANDSITIYSTLPGDYKIKVVRDSLDPSPDSTYTVESRIDGTADYAILSNLPVPEAGQTQEAVITNQPTSLGCLSKPGDANASGNFTLVDIISTVNYVFSRPGCPPQALCWLSNLLCRGDWNGSGTVTLGDVIQGVNHVFNKPGGPWIPLSSDPCCLPAP